MNVIKTHQNTNSLNFGAGSLSSGQYQFPSGKYFPDEVDFATKHAETKDNIWKRKFTQDFVRSTLACIEEDAQFENSYPELPLSKTRRTFKALTFGVSETLIGAGKDIKEALGVFFDCKIYRDRVSLLIADLRAGHKGIKIP